MRADDVPQQRSRLYAGHTRATYAVDRDGRYTTVQSSGWDVEETATQIALADFEQATRAAYRRGAQGHSAALEYHMCASRMDVATLADTCGMARWRVRRHLRPKVFARLPARVLARYARALQVPAADLARLPAVPPGPP